MGDTIWVDVQGRAADDLPPDNSIMLRLDKRLDKLAAKLGVAKLTGFYDYSEIEAQMADLVDGAGADEEEGPAGGDGDAAEKGAWFDPAAALGAVRAIREHLAEHPDDLGFKPDASRQHWSDGLMEELGQCQAALENAQSAGRKFRFLIVP
jgi:hypothetical protein